jgi:hypothetical protein
MASKFKQFEIYDGFSKLEKTILEKNNLDRSGCSDSFFVFFFRPEFKNYREDIFPGNFFRDQMDMGFHIWITPRSPALYRAIPICYMDCRKNFPVDKKTL